MDETFKILETLSRELGIEMSISQLTEKIGESYESAYYANVYNKLQQLAKDNIVTLNKVGNTSIVKLNFEDYWIVDVLAQMEIQKKQEFLKDSDNIAIHMLFTDLERSSRNDYSLVRSISAIRPKKNQMINRVELLVLIKGQGTDVLPKHSDVELLHHMMKIQQMTSPIRIDYLILTETKFLELISSDEINPAREMLADKITIFGPQNFWHTIQTMAEKGIPPKIMKTEIVPPRVSESDLVYNMARFGYNEIGAKVSQGRNICIEYTIAAMLARDDARRIEAVPILLSKNSVNYDMLLFISKKFKLSERLLGLLQALVDIVPENKSVQFATKLMKETGTKAITADRTSILEKMRLYSAA